MKMIKPHGFIIDFIGIFNKLENALAFDSDEVNAVVKDLALLKECFVKKLTEEAQEYFDRFHGAFDQLVGGLIKSNTFVTKKKERYFLNFIIEIEMLYEIISPDAFLRPYIDKYTQP